MSDFWQGPGWWLASDGKWYPADAQPPGDDAAPSGDEAGAASPATGDEHVEVSAAAASTALAVDDLATTDGDDTIELTDAAADEAPSGGLEIDSGSGWQAIEATPEDEYDVSAPNGYGISAVDDLTDESAKGDLAATASAAPTAEDIFTEAPEGEADGGGWEPSEEALEAIDAHEATAVPPPVLPSDLIRTDPIPIERDDAWRKPVGEPLAPSSTPPAGTPHVVDVTAASEPDPSPEVPSISRPIGGYVLVVALVVSIVALAALIGWLFTRVNNDGDTVTIPASTAAPVADDETDVGQTAQSPDNGPAGSTAAPENDDVSVFSLENGDCIRSDLDEGQVQTFVAVDCSEPHKYEVFRQATLTEAITEFDDVAIKAEAERLCAESFENFIPPGDERNLSFIWLQPTQESWELEEDGGDRLITCLIYDQDGPLTGRVAQ